MNIETERLRLRKFKESDLATLIKYRNDPLINKYDGFQYEMTISKGKEFIDEMKNINFPTEDSWVQIAFELKDENKHIGDCGFRMHDRGKQVEIGIRLDREYWGQGLAYEGLTAIFLYAFSSLSVHRIIAKADTRNSNSIKLLSKLRMRKEGQSIESYLENGEWSDEFHFAILAREWKLR